LQNSESTETSSFSPSQSVTIEVRDVLYGELPTVADIIVRSFYVNATGFLWRQMYKLAELNRLQKAFPYNDIQAHRMLVAIRQVSSSWEPPRIVGFCDLDNRRPNQNTGYSYNPRPYLSDLAVDPNYRRQGIAKSLIMRAEELYCQTMRQPELQPPAPPSEEKETYIYIRVEKNNTAALRTYQSLQYRRVHNPDSLDGEILLLRKQLLKGDVDA
jgi:ribosomal protein S18 acetylase RimI-like enzyme